MDRGHKIQLVVSILTAVATIVGSVMAAIITANSEAKETAGNVARQTVEELAPQIKLFPPVYTRKKEIQQLGEWQACVLVAAGESHHDQACTCFIEPSRQNSIEWQLRVNLDLSVDGICNCRAACFNGLSKQS